VIAVVSSMLLCGLLESLPAAGAAGTPTWTTRTVPSGVKTLNDVVCPSAMHCYAVGGYGASRLGAIVGSSDGGDHWHSLLTTPEAMVLASIACSKPGTCVVAGEMNPNGPTTEPQAFLTTDYGAHWSKKSLPEVGDVVGVACASVRVCLVIGNAGPIARTTNGGTTWVLESTPHLAVASVACSTRSFCIIGGTGSSSSSVGPSVASVSQDAGATWSSDVEVSGPLNLTGGSQLSTELGALSCSDARHCVGLIENDVPSGFGSGSPMVTSDGGGTWKRGSRPIGSADDCVDNFCVSVGGHLQPQSGDAFVSTDGGANWKPSTIPTRLIPTAVSCTTSTRCVAVGGDLPDATSAVIMTYS
jgi:photosystem II stability/assembly factor-like uncharacterized protein